METELLGWEIDFEGFEIEILRELVQQEVTRQRALGSDPDRVDDLESLLEKFYK